MARRRIGQEQLAIDGAGRPPRGTSLDGLALLVDWAELDHVLAGISATAKGELGWPPLALFRALLLATWHDLSDVRLAEALNDRASVRRSFGLRPTSPRRNAPPLSASVRRCCVVAWIGPCSRLSRASSMPAASWSAPARWWTRP